MPPSIAHALPNTSLTCSWTEGHCRQARASDAGHVQGRNKKGNRFYTEEDIALLDMIYYLTKVKGYTLKGARERIKADRRNIERNAAVSATLLRVKEFLSELKDGLK